MAAIKQKRKSTLPQRITMHDIAARAQVSLGTVSHVVNGSSSVKEALKQRVLQVIDELGYQPNHLSQGLRRNRTNLIGMIIPDIMNPFFPSVVRGVEDMAFNASYRLLLCNADNSVSKESAYLSDLQSFLPAGIIMIPSIDHRISQERTSTPMVCIDRRPPGWKGDSVTVANEEGGYAAGKHLLEMRHRIIGIVRGPSNVTTAQERVNGFMRAMNEAKLFVPSEYVQEGRFDYESGYACTMRLLSLLPRPTAIFATSDLMATGTLAAVKASKLVCPRDVSIIGFDGLALTELTEPALSTISQPSYQLGYAAARLLLDRIEGEESPPQHIILKIELKRRDSVARI